MLLSGMLLAALLPFPTTAQTRTPEATPRARIISVRDFSLTTEGQTDHPGAGVRAFEMPPDNSGNAYFDIKWYTPPPGLAAGALIYVECTHAWSRDISTHFAPQRQPVEGYTNTLIEVPKAKIREWGTITGWQVSLVYHGRVLDRWASATWRPRKAAPTAAVTSITPAAQPIRNATAPPTPIRRAPPRGGISPGEGR